MNKSDSKGISLFVKLLSAMLGVTIITSGALGTISYIFSREYILTRTKIDLQQQLITIAKHFEAEHGTNLSRNLRELKNSTLLNDYLLQSELHKPIIARKIEREFLQVARDYGYKCLYFVDGTGTEKIGISGSKRVRKYQQLKELEPSDEGKLALIQLFAKLETAKPGKVFTSIPYLDPNGEILFYSGMAKNDPDTGRFGGAVILRTGVKNFFRQFSDRSITWIFRSDGQILYHPTELKSTFNPIGTISENSSSGLERNKVSLSEVAQGVVASTGLFVTPNRPLMQLVVSVPKTVISREVLKALKFFVAISLLGIATVSIVAFFLSKQLSAPIVELASATKRIATGDLLTQVQIKSGGEVQMLVDNFNKMVKDLRVTTVSRDYVNDILNSMEDTLIVVDRGGVVQTINGAATKMLGRSEQELIGAKIGEIIQDDSFIETLNPQKLELEHSIGNIEKVYRSGNGTQIPVLLSVSILRNSTGDMAGIVCLARDITDRKRAEEALRVAMEKAEAGNRAKSEFLSVISHELRTPMNSVIGMTEMMLEFTELDGVQSEYANIVLDSAEDLLKLINNILDFSRIESQELKLEISDFSLRLLLQKATQMIAPKAEHKSLKFTATADPETFPAQLRGDPRRILQIIMNLLDNAVKFTPTGEITFRTELTGETENSIDFRFSIEDTGIGIPIQKIDKLFDPFSQMDSSTTRQFGGLGLGLAISKKLIERMNGEMGVESRIGRGTNFWFSVTLEKA